jgi:hypothetical protein
MPDVTWPPVLSWRMRRSMLDPLGQPEAVDVVRRLCGVGDGGVIDADGYLKITDRKQDVIITGGENVSSSEVEDAIFGHPTSSGSPSSASPTTGGGNWSPQEVGEHAPRFRLLLRQEVSARLGRARHLPGPAAPHVTMRCGPRQPGRPVQVVQLSIELAPLGVRVNQMSPGPTPTRSLRSLLATGPLRSWRVPSTRTDGNLTLCHTSGAGVNLCGPRGQPVTQGCTACISTSVSSAERVVFIRATMSSRR